MHPSLSSNNDGHGQQQRSLGKIEVQQQSLLALQQLGMGVWPIQSLIQNVGLNQQQQTEYYKQILKTTNASSSNSSLIGEQQRMERELSHKRPSLMHDFGGNPAQSSRYSLIQPHLQQVQMNQSLHGFGTTSLSDASYLTEDEEKLKRILNEKLEKIDRERSHAATMQKNAEKKAKSYEKILAKAKQEPSFMAGVNNNDDAEEDQDGISPTDALIERIYAENRQKAATAASSLPPMNIPVEQQTKTTQELMAEDAARLAAEYERGIQLLPMLVQAMRIQRERRQDAMERRRIIYEEQLVAWERKVIGYEKSQKKLMRDVKHKEIFEKTFVELKKMREEKERNNRVERTRFSLAQGGNWLGLTPTTTSSAANASIKNDESQIQIDSNEIRNEQQEIIDEKLYAAALIPPIFSKPPRRYFDNRNGIVENALSESRAQLEAFQNAWNDTEKSIFNEKIALYGKNFAAIAAFIPTKSIKECVQFYYMTKKRNNYKQKLGRRRKKIGRQGYRPPVMPRFGDTDENFKNYNGCAFIECLLCDSRILLLESLAQQNNRRAEHFLGCDFNNQSYSQSTNYQKEIAICTKCVQQAQRSKTLNRCPLGSCICVGGKRKMKSARNIPEKFANLSIDHKRFIISRIKMPPSATKCCTNCFKRITKEIDELLMGELQTEFEAFKNRATIIRTTPQPPKPALIIDGIEEEDDGGMEQKPATMQEIWANVLEGQPPSKEMKITEGVDIKKELECDETAAVNTTGASGGPLLVPQGSITKGTPNRTRNTLLGSANETFEQQQKKMLSSTVSTTNLLVGINSKDQQQQKITTTIGQQIDANSTAIEELTSGLLAQFGFTVPSKEAALELSRQLSGMLGTLPPDWLNNLQAQANIMQQPQQEATMIDKANVVAMGAEANSQSASLQTVEAANNNNNVNGIVESSEQNSQNPMRRNSEIMRRKSGLATAILPSSIPESSNILPATNLNRLNAPRAAVTTAISPSLHPRTETELLLEKEKPLLEQRDSNLTTNSGETLQKTDSNQGQLSSCYESLSDDSDEEKSTTNKQGGGAKQTVPHPTTSISNQPSKTPAPLPAFFTVFDFQDEPVVDEICPQQSQQQPMANYFQTESTTSTRMEAGIPSSSAAAVGVEIYEPLSSDEEN